MTQDRNNQSRFGGQYLIQDSDHMSEIGQSANNAPRGGARQTEQSHSGNRQQGDAVSAHQATGRKRQSH